MSTTSAQDKANPPPSSDGPLFPPPSLQEQVSSLIKELEQERAARREMEKEWRRMRHKLLTYQHLDGIYISLKQAAEAEAQAPIDKHYREALAALEAAQSRDWVANAALTSDIEALRKICLAYADWWNGTAWPLIEKMKGGQA